MNTTQLSPAIRSFGYAAALEAELVRIGPLSLEEFERRYAGSCTTHPAQPPRDPLADARFGEIFRCDPKELLRQQLAAALDTRLPREPGASVPDATLDSLFLLWDTFDTEQETKEERRRGRTGAAWQAVAEYTASHPLLTIVAQWDNWDRQRLEALRGLRFETGSEVLTWLEDDEAIRLRQINQEAIRLKRFYEEHRINPSDFEPNKVSDREALTQAR